mmetsp:Transcript_132398/g.423728  ORF Transcript_132398/g.423728 Transcript_132398/m.423728 type:complete len:304 (-) Transcript_132398:38-949(-)
MPVGDVPAPSTRQPKAGAVPAAAFPSPPFSRSNEATAALPLPLEGPEAPALGKASKGLETGGPTKSPATAAESLLLPPAPPPPPISPSAPPRSAWSSSRVERRRRTSCKTGCVCMRFRRPLKRRCRSTPCVSRRLVLSKWAEIRSLTVASAAPASPEPTPRGPGARDSLWKTWRKALGTAAEAAASLTAAPLPPPPPAAASGRRSSLCTRARTRSRIEAWPPPPNGPEDAPLRSAAAAEDEDEEAAARPLPASMLAHSARAAATLATAAAAATAEAPPPAAAARRMHGAWDSGALQRRNPPHR